MSVKHDARRKDESPEHHSNVLHDREGSQTDNSLTRYVVEPLYKPGKARREKSKGGRCKQRDIDPERTRLPSARRTGVDGSTEEDLKEDQ